MCSRYLRPQQCQLCLVKGATRVSDRSKRSSKACRRDGRNKRGDVAERAVQRWDRSVVKVISRCQRLYLIEGGVAGPDHGNRSVGDRITAGILHTRKIAGGPERFQRRDDIGPRVFSRRFHVDEEVKGLAAVAIKNAVGGFGGDERRGGVLPPENIEDRVNIEGGKGAGRCQGGSVMADVQG